MAQSRNYVCTRCGSAPAPTQREARDLLTVKRVMFTEMGTGARTYRSRVKEWLCPSCLVRDEDYLSEPFKAPGNQPAPTERDELIRG